MNPTKVFCVSLVVLCLFCRIARSDDSESGPSKSRITVQERQFFHDLLGGQKQIWTSPFRLRSHDLIWLGPLAGTTAFALTKDSDWSNEFKPSTSTLDTSRKVSYLGSSRAVISTATAFYLLGKLTHNDRARTTGLLGIEALANTAILIQGTKFITGRERPETGDNDGSFWVRGNSFPSGHSASVWALAAVFSGVYSENKLAQLGAYSIASAVTISRVTGENHFVSDVIVGSTIGYLIGRMVVRQHTILSNQSKLQSITPYIDKKNGKYGMNVSLRW